MLHSHEEREETVRRIARESARLRRLVDQLRQVARYEAGAQSLDRAPLQLHTLVDETLAVLAPELNRHSVRRSTICHRRCRWSTLTATDSPRSC